MSENFTDVLNSMTREERWANVTELAAEIPNPHNNKESHIAHGKASAEIYFRWFPEAEYMITNTGTHGSFLYIAGEDGGVCSVFELGKQLIGS